MRTYLRIMASALCLLLLLLPLAGGAVAAEEAYAINGINVRYNDFSSAPDGCWAYAYNFYYKIWGKTLNSHFYEKENLLRDRSNEELTLTPEHLKEYVSKAKPGAVIRVCNIGCLHGTDDYGHSLVIVSIQEDGFTAFEGGLNGPCSREYFYTWEEFCRTGWLGARYGYIKYIKWPTAFEDTQPVSDEAPERPSRLEALEAPSQAVTYAVGDLNRSGELDAADYVLLKRFVNGTIRLTDAQLVNGDLNGDGQVDEQDFLLLRGSVYRAQLLPQTSFSELTTSLLAYLF